MARIVIREQDLTGNRIDQDFTDIAFIPGFVKYPNKDYEDPQMCWSEGEFINMFGNEPAISNSKFIYNVSYNGTPYSNPNNGQANFVLDANDVEAVSDSAYHYARELLYRGLPIYYCPMNDRYTQEEIDASAGKISQDLLNRMKPFNGVANGEDPKDPANKIVVLSHGESGSEGISQRTLYREVKNGVKLKYTFAKSGYTVTYSWQKKDPGALSFHKLENVPVTTDNICTVSSTAPYYYETGAIYYCIATATKTNDDGRTDTVTSFSEAVTLNTVSDTGTLTILPREDTTTPYVVSNQAASEKIELKVESKEEDNEIVDEAVDPEYKIVAAPARQVVSYNQDVVYTCQVEGINIESFSYVWTLKKVKEYDNGVLKDVTTDKQIEQAVSTQQVCKFSSRTFDPGVYEVRIRLTATPINANVIGTINVNAPAGKELKASQILAAAKAEAITKASRLSSEYFTGKLLDWFTNTENIELLKDRGMYNFKYLTSGGYPIFQAAKINSDGTSSEFGKWQLCLQNMLSICGQKTVDDSKDFIAEDGSTQRQGRGDCIFLIDHQLDRSQDTMELYEQVREWFEDPANVNAETLEFAAMYTPWCKYNMTYTSHNVSVNMPASYAYLTCLADSIQAYDNWHAISGVTRGTVKNIQEILLDKPLTNTKANKCQSDPETAEPGRVSINCITEIKPYGNVIWGNRTLQKADAYKHVTAMGFVNLRNEVSDIKKLVYRAARRWMFEQNTSVLWINFKSTITPLLERMVNGYGLSRYEIRRGEKTKKHKLYAEIRIWPIYAVEYIDVTIQILDEETIVTEE